MGERYDVRNEGSNEEYRVIILLSWLLSVIQLSSEVKNYKSPCGIPSSDSDVSLVLLIKTIIL